MVESLFGGRPKSQGPSEAERAIQRDQQQEAQRADAEADQNVALAARAGSLRRALSFQGRDKKTNLAG